MHACDRAYPLGASPPSGAECPAAWKISRCRFSEVASQDAPLDLSGLWGRPSDTCCVSLESRRRLTLTRPEPARSIRAFLR